MPNLTDELIALDHVLGSGRISSDKIIEYEKALDDLTQSQCAKIFQWFKINGEKFPTIKSIRQQAAAFGWLSRLEQHIEEDWVVVECFCGGSFAVSEKELKGDPTRAYVCPNHRHWECNRTFEAGYILANMDANQTLLLHPIWKSLRQEKAQ